MSEEPGSRKTALTRRPSPYEVGYGKPPVEGRFQPSRSGNPKGWPKGSRNRPPPPEPEQEQLRAIILEEAYRNVPAKDLSGRMMIPMARRSRSTRAAVSRLRVRRRTTAQLTWWMASSTTALLICRVGCRAPPPSRSITRRYLLCSLWPIRGTGGPWLTMLICEPASMSIRAASLTKPWPRRSACRSPTLSMRSARSDCTERGGRPDADGSVLYDPAAFPEGAKALG